MSNNQYSRLLWRPQPGPQYAFVRCPVEEIFFGGARGGGKTDGAIGRNLLKALKYGPGYKGYFIRRELIQLEPAIARSKEVYWPFGTYHEQKKTWYFNSGGRLTFRYVERDSDAEKLQGESCSDINVEEIGNFPDLKPLLKLKAILRSVSGTPVSFCATGNPGGPGHSLIKRRYIDPAPLGWQTIEETDELTGMKTQRVYIPSRVTDNQLLLRNDPGYLARLAKSGSKQLVKAWLDGDFNVIDGAYFDEFDTSRHVLRAVELPRHWLCYRAMDWGSYYPFYCCWMAHASEDWVHPDGMIVPKGSIVVFRELYGSVDHNNEGLKLPADEVGRMLHRIEQELPYKITFGVLDPKQFSSDGGPSVAERMARGTNGKIMFRRADNRRLGKDGAAIGWDAMRSRLRGVPYGEGGHHVPQLFFFDTCVDAIRTLPALQHDPDKPEDCMGAEDHPADAIRYGVMARPWGTPKPVEKSKTILPKDFRSMSLDELWAEHSKLKPRSTEWRV